jgi:hypothetical protein
MSQFGVDGQAVHLETECHSSKLSQQTVRWVDASFGSKCRMAGLSVDGSLRHLLYSPRPSDPFTPSAPPVPSIPSIPSTHSTYYASPIDRILDECV